jgi:alanyl-tRNA synthetase
VDSDGLRRTFRRYFEERGHRWQESAPLVPVGDPTLLFTSAGMVQFKPYFMGIKEAPAPRLTSIQRCFRTSDIEIVGDASHHTFFEMMGNFSVGDYFKDEAIAWAWEFYTKTLGLPRERLRNTVYTTDDIAFNQWVKLGQRPDFIYRYGEEEGNFWLSGDVGPCGPCSEVFYDFGEEFGCGPNCEPSHDCGRFLEIWNLVFMELFQDAEGLRTPLPRKNIDTGAGLERNLRVLAGTPSTFETDLFLPILAAVERATGTPYQRDAESIRISRALADHARALTFLIADGVLPANEGRGYVVRRLIRRSVYYGRLLGAEGAFLSGIAAAVVERMAGDYAFLREQQPNIAATLDAEERRFSETLEGGIARLDALIDRLGEGGVIPGEELFRLHSTYGVPRELTEEIAARRGVQVNGAGFDAEMERERERSRAEGRFRAEVVSEERAALAGAGKGGRFTGYDEFSRSTTITGLFDGTRLLNRAHAGTDVQLVLLDTPFYPEGGGQVGDTGEIRSETGRMRVTDTQRDPSGLLLHYGTVEDGTIAVHQEAFAQVDRERRIGTTRNHSGTHLLHAALREVLGGHVRQMGSLVAPERLRFDYQQPEQPARESLRSVERLVNEKIRQDIPIVTQVMPYREALDQGVLAFFGDKYGDEVRVVEVAGGGHRFSAELCGGTHVEQTGQIGLLLLVNDSSVGAGVRRVEALTGVAAERHVEEQISLLDRLSGALNTGRDGLEARVAALTAEIEALRKAQAMQQKAGAQQIADGLVDSASHVGATAIVAASVADASFDTLLEVGDRLRSRLGSAAIVLASAHEGKAHAVVLLTRDLTERLKAADVISGPLKSKAGITGGGRPDSARGGGGDPSRTAAALEEAKLFIASKLGG